MMSLIKKKLLLIWGVFVPVLLLFLVLLCFTWRYPSFVVHGAVQIRQGPTQFHARFKHLHQNISSKALTQDGKTVNGHPVLMWSESGRLGNILFEYSTSYCMAKKTRHVVLITQGSKLLQLFSNITAIVVSDTYSSNSVYPHVNEERPAKFSEHMETKLQYYGSVKLHGYLQSWKYLKGCTDDLRQQLTIRDEISSASQALLIKLTEELQRSDRNGTNVSPTSSSFVYIGIHVRKGDMDKPNLVKKGYITVNMTFIQHAMEYFKKKYLGRTVFVVISDDMKWCREHISQPDVVFAGSDNDLLDFATLVSCNHTIVSSGSYGWWAGWLTGGTVVYFSKFPVKDSYIGKHYSAKEYYPPNWIPME